MQQLDYEEGNLENNEEMVPINFEMNYDAPQPQQPPKENQILPINNTIISHRELNTPRMETQYQGENLVLKETKGDVKIDAHLHGYMTQLNHWMQDFNVKGSNQRVQTQLAVKEEKVQNVYAGMILLRRLTRILIQFLLLGVLIACFAWGYYVSLELGRWDAKTNPTSVQINVQNCFLNVTESQDQIGFSYVAKGSVFKHVNASEQYKIQGKEENGLAILDFINPFEDVKYCMIELQLPKILDSFQYKCLKESECLMTIHIESFSISSLFNASAEDKALLQINIRDISTPYFKFNSLSAGNLFLNHILSQQSDIQLLSGDIVIQSTEDMYLEFTSSSHSFCMSGPSIQPNFQNCYLNNETKDYLDSKITCSGQLSQCKTSGCIPNQRFYITSNASTIYSNLLKDVGKPYVQDDYPEIMMGGIFDEPLNFDSDTKQKINTFLNKTITDADITVRLDVGGHYLLQQPSNTYWAYFNNPAYASFLPWWISVLSATFLGTEFVHIQASTDPGFCPWYPTATLEQLFELQTTIRTYFNQSSGAAVYMQKDNRPTPLISLDSEAIYSGVEPLVKKSKNQVEQWFTVVETANILGLQTLPYDPFFIASVIVSMVASMIFGLSITFAMAIVLYTLEAYILESTAQYQNYSSSTLKKEASVILKSAVSYMLHKLDQLQSKKDPPVLNGLFSYFWYLVAQNSLKNGAKLFCSIIFTKTNPTQTSEFYNGSMDQKYLQIDESKLKEHYEQFCYLNRLTMDQLSSQEQLLESYGYKIVENGEAIMLSKLKLKSNRKPFHQLTDNERISGNSLELFMATQVQITGIAADILESDKLEQLYYEFCGKALVKLDFNAMKLAHDYGAVISEQKIYKLQKTISGIQEKQNWFIRALGRCTHYLPLIEDYYAEQPVYIINVDTEVNKFMTSPTVTLSSREGIVQHWWYYNFVRMFIESLKFNYKKRIFSREYRFRDGIKEEKNVLQEYFNAIYMQGWIWTDIIVVVGNMTINAILILPFAFYLMIVNTTYAPYALYDPKYLIFENDILERPWSVFSYGYVVDEWVLACSILLLYYGAITFLFLTIKYFFSFFPDEVGFMLEFKLYQYRVMKWFNWFQWLQFLLILFLISTYFGVIIVWLLLGAIINPNNNLVFASAAVTLVATLVAEMNSIKSVYQLACSEIKKLIQEIYLNTFELLASNLIMEISRLSDMSVTLINSTGMGQAKEMAEQLGFGEELGELCILTQGMLDKNSSNTLETDQLNFKAIKDKFIAKACDKFVRIAKEQFDVPELVAEKLVQSNFMKFDEIIDTLANQVQVTSKNQVPATLVKWMYSTSVHISRSLKKRSVEDQRRELQIVLPKITHQLFDAIIEGMMMHTKIEDKGYSKQAIKAVLSCMFNISQDKTPKNMLKQIKDLFGNMKNQVDDGMSRPIMILEQSFNYAEALSDPKVNIDFVQKDLIRQILNLFNLDADISSVIQVLFLKQNQLIEKGQALTATQIAGLIIRFQEKFFELPKNVDPKIKELFDLFIVAAIKYLKNDKLPLQEFINLVGNDNEDVQLFMNSNQQLLNTMLSLIALASKSWKQEFELKVQGTNLDFVTGTLDIATKYIWTTQHIENTQSEVIQDDNNKKEDWDTKTFKKASVKFPSRIKKLISSDLIQAIATPFAISGETLIGMILFFRGEIYESVNHELFYGLVQPIVSKTGQGDFRSVQFILEMLSVKNFEEVQMMKLPTSLIKSLFILTFANRENYEILEGNRLLKKYRNQAGNNQEEQYKKLKEFFPNKKEEFNAMILKIKNIEQDKNAKKEIVNYYKSENVSFYTFLKRSIPQETDRQCKNDFLTTIRNIYDLKIDYLMMLLDIQQNLHDQQSINSNFLPGISVQPLQNLIKIMAFKDTFTVCKGLEYFLNLNPQIKVDLSELSNSLEIFVETEALITSLKLPDSIPYYFQKIFPIILNNILATRIPLSSKVFRDLSSLLLQDLPYPLSTLTQYQPTINLFVDALFEQNKEIRSNQILKLIEFLINNGRPTNKEKATNKQIQQFVMAVIDKNFDKLLKYLENYFKYAQPSEFQNFFKKVTYITRGLTTIQSNQNDSDDAINLVWATQQLKFFITYDQEALMELVNKYFGKIMGNEKANMVAINALFSLFSDKPDIQMLESLYQIQKDQIILLKFLVDVILSEKKSNLLLNPDYQHITETKLGLKDLSPIINLSDILEQKAIEIPSLLKKLKLDINFAANKVFSAYLAIRLQSQHTGSWSGNVQKYQEQVHKRQIYVQSDVQELVLQFSTSRPLNIMYAIAEIPFLEPSGKVAFLFSAIASIAKYDIYNAFSKRQPEYIQHKSNIIQQNEQNVEKTLNFIAETSEQDLVEGLLLLQLATGLNPVLTSGIMNQNNCFELKPQPIQVTKKDKAQSKGKDQDKQKDIIMDQNSCLQDSMSSLVKSDVKIIEIFFAQLASYEKLDAFCRFYIVEYETAKIAVSVENDGKQKDLAKSLETSRLIVQNYLGLNNDELMIVEDFLQQQNKGKLPIQFPLSSAIMMFALKDLRQIKQRKETAVPAYLKGVHLIDLILTVYEKYLYFNDVNLLAQLNKPMLTRLLSFGLFDSPKLRDQQLKQNLIENMLYPSMSDIMMGQKYHRTFKLNYCVEKQNSLSFLTKFFIENSQTYYEIMIPIVNEAQGPKPENQKLEPKWLAFNQTWTFFFTSKRNEQFNPPQLILSKLDENFSVSKYYDEQISKMPETKSLNYIKLQNQLIQKLIYLNLITVGHLRTKYYDKSLSLTKKKLLKYSEIEILNSDQLFASQETLISNLLKFYAGQYQIEQSQQLINSKQVLPLQQQPLTPKEFYSNFVVKESHLATQFRGEKSKNPINLTQFIDSLLAVDLNEQERREYKFIIDLLYNPKQINIDELNKLWNGLNIKMNGLMLMLIRMQLEQSKSEGKFTQMANKVPTCFLYYSIGDQYENKEEENKYIQNNKEMNFGMDELIQDCVEIQPKIRSSLKLMIRCYLGDVEAWYTLIAFSRNQNSVNTDLLSENMIHSFIVELLLKLKNMGLRNAKIGKTELVSQSFLHVLSNQSNFNLKKTFESVLVKVFQEAQRDQPKVLCQQFIQYLDFIVDGNISVLKKDFMQILQGAFEMKSDVWQLQKPKIQFLLQLLFNGNCSNENFEEFEKNVQHKLPTEEWKIIKIFIEVYHSNDLKIIVKKLIQYISSKEQFKQSYTPYIAILTSLSTIQNLKFLPEKKENSTEVIDLLLYPVYFIGSLMQDQEDKVGSIAKEMIQFCTKKFKTNVDTLLPFVDKILNHNEQVEQNSRDSPQILMQQVNIDYYVQGFKDWCNKNADSNFKIVQETLSKQFDLNQFPDLVKSIINVLLALMKSEDPKALMKQFLGDLTNHKDLVAQKKVIIAAIEGLSDIKDPKQIKEPKFQATILDLLQEYKEFQGLAKILLNFYASENFEDLKDLPTIIQKVCFSGIAYQDKFKDVPLDQIFTVVSQTIVFMNEIEKDKNIDENKLLALCQPVFMAMFKKEQMKDLNILMKCLESFIAIKNKKFNEINQEFFTIMGISQQNSQLLVNMMQDFQKALDTPQKMIKEKMGQFVNSTVVNQMQQVNSVTQKLLSNQKLSYDDMFRIIDRNGERVVLASDALIFIRRINIQITDHKFREVLVQRKQEQVTEETCKIDVQDFKQIMDQISLQTMYLALEYTGISKGQLIKGLIVLIIYLILVIIFILIGVKAFAIPGTFASIVNSVLPLLGGFALNKSAVEERLKSLNTQRVRDIVAKAVKVLQTARV